MKAIVLVILGLVLALAARLPVTICLLAGHLTVPAAGLVLAALAAAMAGLAWVVARRVLEWPHVSGAWQAAAAWGTP